MSASEAKAAIFGYRCNVGEGPFADNATVVQIAAVTHSRPAPQGITQTTAPAVDGTGF